MKSKQRADMLLLARGMAESRAKAQALIMAGHVFSEDKRIEKPGQLLEDSVPLEIKGQPHPWVSRGGMKLDHAIRHFNLDPVSVIALDIGASTGGFTDVLLQQGAARVYAVDVGHGQLAWKLRQDNRVIVLERKNARYLNGADVPDLIDWVVCDASFIGLRTILPAALALTKAGSILVALIKPQFEVGAENVGRRGVVQDPALHEEVCATISDWLNAQTGWAVIGLCESPILGPEGNREFLIAAKRHQ